MQHGQGACDVPTVQELELQEVIRAINQILGDRHSILVTLQENVEKVIRQEDESSIEGIETELEKLQRELLKRANSKEDYINVADEIYRLQELK